MQRASAGSAVDGLVPVLETERLRLRGHRAEDHEALAAIWADPEVIRYMGGTPSSWQESWMRLLRYPGLWALLGYGFWAIEEKASGRMIGDIGYTDFKREIEPPLDGMPELGWALARDTQGKGYASEALTAVLAWGRAHFGPHRATCIIDPDNAASIRLATKAGFRFSHATTYRDDPTHVFVRDEA
ncbi:MAG: N-acetyltransferase [Rhodanobacter sp.]|nr:MAG: N-acetyltransferase [Rhodanobacter sp.]